MTAATLDLDAHACLRFLEARVTELAGRVSLSARVTGAAPSWRRCSAAGAERFPELAAALGRRNPEEPYRRALA